MMLTFEEKTPGRLGTKRMTFGRKASWVYNMAATLLFTFYVLYKLQERVVKAKFCSIEDKAR